MKTVFTNDQCAHVWAQQTQSEGRSNNGNMFFGNNTIYSYGHHFPIATFLNPDTIVYNSDSYSVSTSKHQGIVRSATNHIKNRLFVDTATLKDITSFQKLMPDAKKRIEQKAMDKMEEHLQSACKRRKRELVASDIHSGIANLKGILSVIEALGRKPSVKYRNYLKRITSDHSGELEGARKRLDDLKAKSTKKAQEALEKWSMGHLPSVPYSLRHYVDTALMVRGDTVHTSEGATFPVEDAKLAFKIINMVRSGALDPAETNDSHLKLGYFKIDKITKQGHVRAGCHFVKWPAIEACARELNIYP